MTIGILQGDLCFADTSQAMECRSLRQRDCSINPKLGVERLQDLLAPGEEWIA
ncbi:MAG TPA: hypothetical protein VH593_00320 [Ktedonobacteraceae bacterium]